MEDAAKEEMEKGRRACLSCCVEYVHDVFFFEGVHLSIFKIRFRYDVDS